MKHLRVLEDAGLVVEVDPPRKLVQTCRALWDPQMMAEAITRLPREIEVVEGGVTKLTVIHELDGAPRTAAAVAGAVPGAGGGWSWILSDLKTLLDTGKPLAG